jgi:uncharacterized membrane protein
MDDSELSDVAGQMDLVALDPNHTIFREGDTGDSMYMIKTGEVRISIKSIDGKDDVTLSKLEPGAFFGEMSVFDGKPRSASAMTTEQTQLYRLSLNDFRAFLVRKPHAALDVLSILAGRLRQTDEMMRQMVSRNVNEEIEEHMTFGDRIADSIAAFGGSWTFIIIFCAILIAWMVGNVILATRAFDAFPFIFLNLVLSCVAALQAPVIMMSQNRASDKDRLHAELDYQVNLKNEIALIKIMNQMDKLHEQEVHELVTTQREQIEILKKLLQESKSQSGAISSN